MWPAAGPTLSSPLRHRKRALQLYRMYEEQELSTPSSDSGGLAQMETDSSSSSQTQNGDTASSSPGRLSALRRQLTRGLSSTRKDDSTGTDDSLARHTGMGEKPDSYIPGRMSHVRRHLTRGLVFRAAITTAVALCLLLSSASLSLTAGGGGPGRGEVGRRLDSLAESLVSLGLRPHICPSGWVHHRGSCYYFSYSTASWQVARRICRDRHPQADLATPRTREENRFIRGEGGTRLPFVWLGGADTEEEGVWRWADGGEIPAQLLEDNWAKGQPDNYGHTAATRTVSGRTGRGPGRTPAVLRDTSLSVR